MPRYYYGRPVLIQHPQKSDTLISGVWLGVNLIMDTKKTCVWKRLDSMLQTILGSTGNIIGGIYVIS